MKELSIEEKAKAYDEAKARMSRAWNDNRCTLGFMNEIFPELKESEEEKTKRTLHSISNKISFHLCDIFTEEEFQYFDTWSNSWLEKQGEEKVQAKSLWHEYYHPIDKDRLFLLISKDKRASIMSWNGESLKSVTFGGGGGIILEGDKFAYIDELQEIQKSAEWGVEDESLRLRTIGALETCKIGSPTKCVDEQINWLKSLKQRYTWKPSKEQMDALNNARWNAPFNIEILDSLYNDLKKLKGE